MHVTIPRSLKAHDLASLNIRSKAYRSYREFSNFVDQFMDLLFMVSGALLATRHI
jgi:hypothetical protein